MAIQAAGPAVVTAIPAAGRISALLAAGEGKAALGAAGDSMTGTLFSNMGQQNVQSAKAISGREALDRQILSTLFQQGSAMMQEGSALDQIAMSNISNVISGMQLGAMASGAAASNAQTRGQAQGQTKQDIQKEQGTKTAEKEGEKKQEGETTKASGGLGGFLSNIDDYVMETMKDLMRETMQEAVDFKGLIEAVINDGSTTPSGEGVIGSHPFAGWMEERQKTRKDQELLNRQGAR